MKRFLLTVLSGLFLAPSGFAILDTNHNGVSDLWEKAQNNGELFPGTLDSQADPDLDGWTNAQEAAAGTNPFDPNPPDGLIRPEVAHIPAVLGEPDENGVPTLITPEAVTVTWPTLVGKQYTLLFSPDLTEGSWIPVGDSFIGHGSEVTYGFEVSDSDKRFWRVSVGDVDTDSDGLSNHEEFLVGTNPTILDSDGDTLSDSAELIAGTDPLQTDADGDGWMDSQEIAAGTDSRNQDSDGDGIPDPIDSQPLVGALAFPDADGDGIADSDDAAPNDPRGPAPTIISETAAGNPVSNLVKAETARFILSVTNPSGPAPTASNLTLFLNGTEETASITAIGSPGASSQRFLLTWTSQTTTDYPTRTLQNLALRFRDAQMATTWLKLARIDVAEWEGYIAMAPVRHTETDGNNIDLEIESHINGRRYADFFGNSRGVCECYYRGPRSISVRNQASHAPIAAFQISEGAKSPLFITRFTAEGISNTSTIDAGNFTSYPHNSAWFFNHTASPLRYDWGNIVTEVGGNSTGLAEYGDSWGASEIAVDWLADPLRAICRSTWQHEWPFIATMDRQVHAAYPLNGSPWVTAYGLTLRSKLPASITPHLAGTVEVPGLPLHPLAIEKEGILFPVASETYHQILYKVDPAAGVWTAGIKLHLGRTSGQDTTPQTGIDLYDFTSGVPEPVSLDASGDLLLSPTQNTVLYQKLTSSGGLPLFLKRTSTADQPHTLEIRFVSKYEANKETTVAAVNLLPVEVVSDYNRDGKIDQADSGKITTEKPWRFWINDDDDSGETEGTDISQGAAASDTNGKNSHADGLRDLVDFFPLKLDIKTALQTLPPANYYYRLTHSGTTADPLLRVIQAPELMPLASSDYLKSMDVAKSMEYEESRALHAYGPLLEDDFLAAAEEGEGLLLIEGVKPTTSPIILKIQKKLDGSIIAEIPFQVKISGINEMFRYKFVMPGAADLSTGDVPADPPNWPDADRNEKHFVLAHGYNVNDTQSKGWGGEAFKRLFWSGSNARFTAFGWYGYQGQTPDLPVVGRITADYQVNLDNAFGTAKSFKQFLDLLEGEKTVAGHSMGNILVGSAMHDWGARPKNYFMLNAAAAKECYDPVEADEPVQDAAMENQIWRGYPKILRASEWHRLLQPAAWPGSDWRGKLTWRGRFANVIQNGGQTEVYNFYSSGEEVLNNPTLNTPQTNDVINEIWSKANRVWAVQEKRKGHGITGIVHTSNYGGWKFNLMTVYDSVIHDNSSGNILMKTPAQLPSPLSNALLLHLASNPFFDRSAHPALYEPETGSNSSGSIYAYNHRNTIISEMIPCTSFAAGRNAIDVLGERNFDMNTEMKTDLDKWPLSNANENNKLPTDREARPWLHSDIREKAFTHNWNAYTKFVELGNLNQSN